MLQRTVISQDALCCADIKTFVRTTCLADLHGYTVHQLYQLLYCPTNALKYIKPLNC